MRSSCIIHMVPNSSKCAYKRKSEGDLRQRITHRRGQGRVKAEAEIAAELPQATEPWIHQKLEEATNRFSP